MPIVRFLLLSQLIAIAVVSVQAQPTTVNCTLGTLLSTYCWTNNDLTIRDYQSSNGYPLKVTFNSGILGPQDLIIVTDGMNGTGNELAVIGSNSASTDLNAPIYHYISSTGMLSIQWDTGPTNSCTAPAPDATLTNYTLECLGCLFPTGSAVRDYGACPDAELLVDITSTGSSQDVDVYWTDNSTLGCFGTVPGLSVGQYSVTFCALANPLTIKIIPDDTACTHVFEYWVEPCPTPVTCGTQASGSHCYSAQDATVFSYESDTGDPLTISFSAGSIEANADLIEIYDGNDATGQLIYQGNNGGDLSGLTLTALSGKLFMRIVSDGIADCAGGSPCCQTPWTWNVQCTAASGCYFPIVAEVDSNFSACPAGILLVIPISSTGDGSTVMIEYTVDGGPPLTDGPFPIGTAVIGPVPGGALIDLLVRHESDTTCDLDLPSFFAPICPCVEPTATAGILVSSCPIGPSASVNVLTTGFDTQVNILWTLVSATPPHAELLSGNIGPVGTGPVSIGPFPNSALDSLVSGALLELSVSTVYDPFCLSNLPTLEVYSCVANDDVANATPILCGQVLTGTTPGATPDLPSNCDGNNQESNSVWFTTTGTADQDPGGDVITFSTCHAGTDYDTKLDLFSGLPGALSCVASNDDACGGLSSEITFTCTPGETYYLKVHGPGFIHAGNFELSMTCAAPCPEPPNDDCSTAEVLTIQPTNGGLSTPGDNTCAVPGYDGPPCAGIVENRSLFYVVNAGQLTELQLDVNATTLSNATVSVRAAFCSGAAVVCDAGVGPAYSVTFPVTPNWDYYIQVMSPTQSGGEGTFEVMVSEPPPCLPAMTNGTCANATTVSVGSFATTTSLTGNNTCAPEGPATASCAGGSNTRSAWYSFLGPPAFEAVLWVYPESMTEYGVATYYGCGALYQQQCYGPFTGPFLASDFFFPGAWYGWEVFSWNAGATGGFTTGIAEPPLCANATCATAQSVAVQSAGSGIRTMGSTACASSTTAVPSCSNSTAVQDAWFTTNAGTAQQFMFTIRSYTLAELGVEVYEGGCGGTQVWCGEAGTAGPYTFNLMVIPGMDYRIRVFSDAAGGGGVFDILIEEEDPTTALAVRAFLEGPYDPNTGLMNDDLRANGLIPLQEPYTALGYAFVSGGGEAAAPTVFTATGNEAIVDWVLVELRDDVDPTLVHYSRAALLQRDGDVVGVDGISPLAIPIPPGNYYVALRHRNHLGVMAAATTPFGAAAVSVDLTDAATATYGTDARKSVSGIHPARVLWSGDVSFDGEIKYTGSGNDRDPILTIVGGSIPTNTTSGYLQEDVNLDGESKYTGGANDRDPILLNIGGTIPTNVRQEQLP